MNQLAASDSPPLYSNDLMKNLHRMHRRDLLRGAGLTLTLPFLESNVTPALAAANDQERNPRRLVCVGNHLGLLSR